MSRLVHLNGSAPFPDAETTLRAYARGLNGLVERMPDGEFGWRREWVLGPAEMFRRHTDFSPDRAQSDWRNTKQTIDTFVVKSGRSARDVRFGSTGYADEAINSYAVFKRLQKEGALPDPLKFQVCLPTPFCIIWFNVAKLADQQALLPAYEDAMRRDIERMAAAIPHRELAIQWDVATELIGLERGTVGGAGTAFPDRIWPFHNMLEEISEMVARLCGYIPRDIDLLLHLCYGDFGHKHSIEPKDASTMVSLANAIFEHVQRPVDLLHLPVPRNRDDDAFFEPLKRLRLPDDTTLALGLVHYTDGVEGTMRRIKVADKYIKGYAIGTECGLGRRPPDTIEELFRIHRVAAESA